MGITAMLKPAALFLLGGSLTLTSAQAFELDDPFVTHTEVSPAPAKNLLGDPTLACPGTHTLPTPLQLLDVVEQALCHNPQTLRAWAQVKAQAASVGSAVATYLPTLELRSSANQNERSSRFDANPYYDTHVNAFDSASSVNVNWVLFDFGLRAANLEVARRLLNAANASQDDALQSLFFDTVQAFYAAQAARALVEVQQEATQAAQQSVLAAEEKHRVGVGALADTLQARTTAAQSRSKLIQSEGELSYAVGNLAMLMGLSPTTPLQLPAITAQQLSDQQFSQAVDLLIEQAKRVHPKIRAAQAHLQAAQAKSAAVQAQGLPNLAFSAAEEFYYTNATPINNQGASAQQLETRRVGLQLNIPLFEGFGRQYKLRASAAEAQSKAAELANTEQQIALEVWKSYQGLRSESQNVQASEELNSSATQSFAVAAGRYKAGVGSMLELLKAQTDLASAKQQQLLAITRWHTAKFRLALSLGQLNLHALPSSVK